MEGGMPEMLGVDLNGPIVQRIEPFRFTNLPGDRLCPTQLIEGSVEALRTLRHRFPKIYVVSICLPRHVRLSRFFLQEADFYRKTGICYDDVHYCWGTGSKGPVCESLGVTHFIDDRLAVLSSLETVANRYLFGGRQYEIDRCPDHGELLKEVQRVESWQEVLTLLF